MKNKSIKILAVDTSSLVAAVAIMDDSKLLGEYVLNHKKTHSQKLMPMIQELMKSLEITPNDIDYYAVSEGPGSFTGLRIGVTAVKAMAYASNKPIIGIPTLDALAYNVYGFDGLICPIMDARNNQVYTALYERNGSKPCRIMDYMGITVSELADIIKHDGRDVIFVGDAVMVHREFFLRELGDKCNISNISLMHQRASSIAELALLKINENDGLDAIESSFSFMPFYLRKSQAERLSECTESKNTGVESTIPTTSARNI